MATVCVFGLFVMFSQTRLNLLNRRGDIPLGKLRKIQIFQIKSGTRVYPSNTGTFGRIHPGLDANTSTHTHTHTPSGNVV